MKENKTFVVAVATVAILVVIFTGITYAFFTTNTNLDGSTIVVTGG